MALDNVCNLPLSVQKKLRNQEIFMQIASGDTKEEVCKRWHLSLRQLNRILVEANKEAEEWYVSLPRRTMIQIFRHCSDKVFCEIARLEEIRERIAYQDPKLEYEMTRAIINAYAQYNKMVGEGPSLTRQKEVTDAAEKIIEKK